jgi:hypothetical protein
VRLPVTRQGALAGGQHLHRHHAGSWVGGCMLFLFPHMHETTTPHWIELAYKPMIVIHWQHPILVG